MISATTKDTDELCNKVLSVALIGIEDERCHNIAKALTEAHASVSRIFPTYPNLDDVPHLLEEDYDVIIVELDSNPEYALQLVENICGTRSVTVMAYSARVDSDMLVRCMRAGAREFLTEPIAQSTIEEALVRASARRPTVPPAKKVAGKLLVFVGAKGGAGVTTIASNFAVALAKLSGESTVLIDLNLPLGDAAISLGINALYSTANALHNYEKLDFNFLSKLLNKHSSGLYVLAAPDKYAQIEASDEAVRKLLTVVRDNFDYVVVDAGSRFDAMGSALFQYSSILYLVMQIGVSELRNSNRLISGVLKASGANIEIVLNRYQPNTLGIDEDSIAKALTMPVRWKIPNDYVTVQHAQNTATPFALNDSHIAQIIEQMTREARGLPVTPIKRRGFNFFG